MDQGLLVPDEVMIGLVKERSAKSDATEGFVLDGFPRTVPQAEALDSMLQTRGQRLDAAIGLAAPEDELVRRLTARRECPKCKRAYNLESAPPADGRHCDDHPGTELTCVADSDTDRARQVATDVGREFTSICEALSRTDVDCVVASVPNKFHPSTVIPALNHGKPVWCEKPLARNPQEAAEIVDAAVRNSPLYMYSLGIFNEGGGSYTASMRYLTPAVSLVVAVTLIQDYVLTIVVSSLSGVDQFLSVINQYDAFWLIRFAIGAALASITCWLTIRGRGESAMVVFILLGVFILMTVVMAVGLIVASGRGVAPLPESEAIHTTTSLGEALMHLLTASMKGMVALSGLEAMSNGIQFVINEDAGFVKWGKKHLPRLKGMWHFYSGKSGIGRAVQTSFLFYGGLTTFLLTLFAIRFNAFDGTEGRSLVGNLAFVGFGQIPGVDLSALGLQGSILFWVYQLLAVVLLAAASMTAFQDLQATAWRDVAIGEIPEFVVYRNPSGTFMSARL